MIRVVCKDYIFLLFFLYYPDIFFSLVFAKLSLVSKTEEEGIRKKSGLCFSDNSYGWSS